MQITYSRFVLDAIHFLIKMLLKNHFESRNVNQSEISRTLYDRREMAMLKYDVEEVMNKISIVHHNLCQLHVSIENNFRGDNIIRLMPLCMTYARTTGDQNMQFRSRSRRIACAGAVVGDSRQCPSVRSPLTNLQLERRNCKLRLCG